MSDSTRLGNSSLRSLTGQRAVGRTSNSGSRCSSRFSYRAWFLLVCRRGLRERSHSLKRSSSTAATLPPSPRSCLSRAIPRTKRPSRPENAEEILDERVADAFVEAEDDEPHNKQPVMRRKAGSSTTLFVRMAGLSSAFSIRLSHNPGITHSGCTTLTIHTSLDRWFVRTNQRSASRRRLRQVRFL